MGVRKHNMAQQLKESRKSKAFAKLTNCPTSPRKMRLVADQVRGVEVEKALQILKFSPKEASTFLACQFAIADNNNFSKFIDASFGLNFKICKAFSTSTPLT